MASTFMQQFTRKTKDVAKRSTKRYVEEALYRNLLKEGSEEESVRQQLNQFLKSHKSAFKWEVDHSIKLLRQRHLYGPALKLSETMKKRGMNKTTSDEAIHLDLIAKTRGIASAETYFVTLPDTSKNHLIYCALLNCYCKALMVRKAEALMEKMKELNLELTAMPYNSLMTLYTKIGQPEKVSSMIQEMKDSNIMPDSFTYNVWMRALTAANDINGVERVIDEMKRDGRVSSDWTTYSNLASIYADAGLFDKTEKALVELEKKNDRRDLSAYQYLITLYARTGNIREVYRVWRSLRLAFRKTANISYLNMIQALVNLNDLPGAEKCFREWESGQPTYDIRIANVLIGAYLKNGSLEKAEELKERARRCGAKANAKTWEIFLHHYLQSGDIKLALECIQNAISIGRGDGSKWVPPSAVVTEFMEHFEQTKDVDGAEGFLEVLKQSVEALDLNVFETLLRTYAAAGRTSPAMRYRIKMENVELSEEGKKLLEVICVE
ncbi:OLC1v1026081C1 [Oldenlandia corymbosa var. corymbosa]|uniref:OLC1v1026081C1 n=1 Tax=Oldenlandia corymbosa var. corymbosa TaxID=529605 RepID=A0AAV1C685_OLDCO|nr:OLC1v1026081C1 [Oldenlandia corymbosa var. corymbosa]